jgi:hypothetical protein
MVAKPLKPDKIKAKPFEKRTNMSGYEWSAILFQPWTIQMVVRLSKSGLT